MINKKGRIRFSKAPWFDHVINSTVTVVGAGGIGSWLSHFLARMGVNVELYDMDYFNINNMGGQLVHVNSITKSKVKSTADLVNGLIGENRINPHHERFETTSTVTPIVFAAVDSMIARRDIYNAWKANDERLLFIDGRMGAEQFSVVSAHIEKDKYMDHWFPPSEAQPLPCAYKATSHIGSMVASTMVGVMTNYFCDEDVPESINFNIQMFDMDLIL